MQNYLIFPPTPQLRSVITRLWSFTGLMGISRLCASVLLPLSSGGRTGTLQIQSQIFPDGTLKKKSVYIKIILGTAAEINTPPLFTNYSQGRKPNHGLVCNEAMLVTESFSFPFLGTRFCLPTRLLREHINPPDLVKSGWRMKCILKNIYK